MAYFTSLLNGNVYEVNDIDSSEIAPQIPPFSTQEPTQSKKGRANNFSMEEDMLLISSWQNISMDPIQGTNQTHQTYWDRIAAYYEENKTFSSERTSNSLSHRWSAINTSVSKFVGIYNQIQGRNQSGMTEQDKKKTQKSSSDSPKSSASAQSQFNSKPSQDSEERMERPMGRKAAKRLKRTEIEAKDDEFISAITQAQDTMIRQSEARNETIKQLIELEKERVRAAEEREKAREEREKAREEREHQMHELSILGIDTTTMEAPLAEYYKSLKAAILKKRI